MSGRQEAYLGWFFEHWSWRRTALDAEAVSEYVRDFSRPGRLRAGFADYRATFTRDLPADEKSFLAGQPLEMPLLALWARRVSSPGCPSRTSGAGTRPTSEPRPSPTADTSSRRSDPTRSCSA